MLLDVDDVRVTFERGHVNVKICGTVTTNFYLLSENKVVRLDVVGDYFQALPPGASTVVGWMLPKRLRGDDFRDLGAVGNRVQTLTRRTLKLRLGDGRLSSKAWLKGHLQRQVDAGGDPIIVLHVLRARDEREDMRLFCAVPFKCSDLIKGLDNNANCMYSGTDTPPHLLQRRPSRAYLYWIRWLTCATLFTLGCWCLYMYPHATLRYSPFFNLLRLSGGKSIREVLPPHPKLMSHAFDLGMLSHELSLLDSASSPQGVGILKKAAQVLKWEHAPLSAEQLHSVRDRLLEIESRTSTIQRVTGFFTFVNIIWLVAILGLTVSFGPALYQIMKPLQLLLMRIAQRVYDVAKKVVRFLHENGVLEILAWALCWLLVIEGARGPPESGFYVILTALAFVMPAISYSTLLYGKKPTMAMSGDQIIELVGVWLALMFAPMALRCESTLLGYFAVWSAYSALGFSLACSSLCWYVGWRTLDSLIRTAVTSFMMLAFYTGMRVMRIDTALLRPFASAITVMGSITMYLALVILSSKWQNGRDGVPPYAHRQLLVIAALLTGLFVGHVFVLPGIANTATTFLVMYIWEKWAELHLENKWSIWILVLLASCGLYACALYLHAHPEFVASLFDATL